MYRQKGLVVCLCRRQVLIFILIGRLPKRSSIAGLFRFKAFDGLILLQIEQLGLGRSEADKNVQEQLSSDS